MSKRTALYRFWDAGNVLLYIGISENPDARFAKHEALKPWWPHVVRKAIEWYDNRELAEAAETEAIRTERSLYNVAGSPWAPKPRELGRCEMQLTEARANLGDVTDRVRLCREAIFIVGRTRERQPRVALVPADLADAAEAAGGLDRAAEILRSAVQS